MTIDSAYYPDYWDLNETGVYYFNHEQAGLDSVIRVYTVDYDDGSKNLTLLPDTEYALRRNTYRAPMFDGGGIWITGSIPANAVGIQIHRVTAITDTQDFPTKEPFNVEAFEFQADKLTLILQEIEADLCDCRDEGDYVAPAQCMVYALDSYHQAILGHSGATAYWRWDDGYKTTTPITFNSFAGATNDYSPIGMTSFDDYGLLLEQPPVIDDGRTSMISNNTTLNTPYQGATPIWWGTSANFICSTVFSKQDEAMLIQMSRRGELVYTDTTVTDTDYFIRVKLLADGKIEALVEGEGPAPDGGRNQEQTKTTSIPIMSAVDGVQAIMVVWDGTAGTMQCYRNYVLVETLTFTIAFQPGPVLNPYPTNSQSHSSSASNTLRMGYTWFSQDNSITSSQLLELKTGFERNFTSYADPNPNCAPPTPPPSGPLTQIKFTNGDPVTFINEDIVEFL